MDQKRLPPLMEMVVLAALLDLSLAEPLVLQGAQLLAEMVNRVLPCVPALAAAVALQMERRQRPETVVPVELRAAVAAVAAAD